MLNREVDYVDSRAYQVQGQADVSSVPEYKDALAQAIFRKAMRDKSQAEHRFAFLITHPKLGVLSVAEAPIRIPLCRLHALVSNVIP
jgi:hypothetical protein